MNRCVGRLGLSDVELGRRQTGVALNTLIFANDGIMKFYHDHGYDYNPY